MTKILIAISIIFISHSLYAQDSIKIKEVGISFTTLNSFGLTYKAGNKNSVWRFNTLFISGSQNNEIADSLERSDNFYGFSFEIGKEYRHWAREICRSRDPGKVVRAHSSRSCPSGAELSKVKQGVLATTSMGSRFFCDEFWKCKCREDCGSLRKPRC